MELWLGLTGYKDKKKLYQVANTFIFVVKLGILTSKVIGFWLFWSQSHSKELQVLALFHFDACRWFNSFFCHSFVSYSVTVDLQPFDALSFFYCFQYRSVRRALFFFHTDVFHYFYQFPASSVNLSGIAVIHSICHSTFSLSDVVNDS